MGRPKEVGKAFYVEAFLKAAQQQRDRRVYRRLLALHHVQSGDSYAQAGQKVCVHWRSVQDWVNRYEANGRFGLAEQPGRGKKPSLDPPTAAAFKARLIQAQAARSGGRLTGLEAQALLKQRFAITLSLASVYRLLHRVGLSWITGRARHPAANPGMQAAFKKTSFKRSNESSHPESP